MGAAGSHGPRPWVQRQARTNFLRVPAADWIAVSRGLKTEFRASPRSCSHLFSVEPPTPVVAYRESRTLGYDSKLMVLERRWQEPLGAISKESLRREGFETLREFRSYWCSRERRRFEPMRMVMAYVVSACTDEDAVARGLFERLYGEHL